MKQKCLKSEGRYICQNKFCRGWNRCGDAVLGIKDDKPIPCPSYKFSLKNWLKSLWEATKHKIKP